jgi:hypothetical protein
MTTRHVILTLLSGGILVLGASTAEARILPVGAARTTEASSHFTAAAVTAMGHRYQAAKNAESDVFSSPTPRFAPTVNQCGRLCIRHIGGVLLGAVAVTGDTLRVHYANGEVTDFATQGPAMAGLPNERIVYFQAPGPVNFVQLLRNGSVIASENALDTP